jgi:hypothetical protein
MGLLDVIGFQEAIVAHDDNFDMNPVAGSLSVAMPASLADAIAPLRDLVPSIAEHHLNVVKAVREHLKDNTDSAFREQVSAILLFTHDDPKNTGCKFYQQLNVALRSRIRDKAKPFFGYLQMMSSALQRLPVYKGTVYRGIAGVDLSSKFSVDKPVRVWEVQSVSKKRGVAVTFARQGGKSPMTLLAIETSGVPELGSLSLFPDEEECLFLPGSMFVATKIEKDGSFAVIYLLHRAEDVTKFYK